MKLSIIIPVYNALPHLRQALESLSVQTHGEWEAICVDDGSTDGGGMVLDETAASDPRIKVIHQENRGTLIARQVAVAAATGDWCLFLDPDDALEPQALERLTPVLAKSGLEIVQCGVRVFSDVSADETCLAASERYFNAPAQQLASRDFASAIIFARNLPWSLIGKIVRTDVCRRAFAAQRQIECISQEDLYSVLGLLAEATGVQVVSEKLYGYRYGNGVSSSPRLTAELFLRTLSKFELLDDMGRIVGLLFADKAEAEKATLALKRTMIAASFVHVSERMAREDRGAAFSALCARVSEADLIMTLVERYALSSQLLCNRLAAIGACGLLPIVTARQLEGLRRGHNTRFQALEKRCRDLENEIRDLKAKLGEG